MTKKTFRDGSYYRHVRFGKRTVKEGECAAIWGYDGQRKVVVGPQRVRLLFAHVRFLDRYVADQNQYLEILFRDGRKETHRGPLAVFMDPCLHVSVAQKQALKLAANEALIVYREQTGASPSLAPPVAMGKATGKANANGAAPEDVNLTAVGVLNSVARRIVRGPAVFIPGAHEWVHEFSWHGSIDDQTGRGSKTGSPGDEKVPHALNFTKLRCMPDQMYVSVKGVRTTDDAQITVHLMLFYELKHIEAMLDATNDPIGDFINAVSADVMTFGSANTYESLMAATAALSDLESFPILAGRMQQTGFELLKIVYRGYSASGTLQSMHDQAIATRTKLKLEADTARLQQAQTSMDLQCKQERSRAEMDLGAAERKHKNAMLDLEAEQRRAARDADHAQSLRHDAERTRQQLEALTLQNDEELRLNASLHKLGVDLTTLLSAQAGREPDQFIKIDGNEGASAPALHLTVPQRKAATRA